MEFTIVKRNRQMDSVQYIYNGLYEVFNTPIKSEHYDVAIQIDGQFLSTDLSTGLNVKPSSPDATFSLHDATLAVKAGEKKMNLW